MHLPTLLIDPDEHTAKTLVAQLINTGFPANFALNATVAFSLLDSQPFMAVIVVADLAAATCRSCIAELRQSFPQVWLIVLTRNPVPDALETVRRLGGDALLSIPFALADLRYRLAAFSLRSRPTF